MDEDDENKQPIEDVRIQFFQQYVMNSLRLKMDKWLKLMKTEEFWGIIQEFLANETKECLLFAINSGSFLEPYLKFPDKPKGKVCYFFRRNVPSTLKMENMTSTLIYGDCSPNPINDLSAVVDNIFLPMIKNPANQNGWTVEITSDIHLQVQKLRNAINEFKGFISNRTILPIPLVMEQVMAVVHRLAEGDKKVITFPMRTSLETVARHWERIIYKYIMIDARQIIYEQDKNPTPYNLIDFWTARLTNLEDIGEQFRDTRARVMYHVLGIISSSYLPSLKINIEYVYKALDEARDITLYLKPLEHFIRKLESMELDECRSLLEPLLQIISLIWSNSKYLCTNNNMSLIFTMLNNFLMGCATKTLDPGGLLQGEADEALLKVNTIISILTDYKITIEHSKNDLKLYRPRGGGKAQYWTWRYDSVFNRMDQFMMRLGDIQEILQIANEFSKLERVHVGGVMGRSINAHLEKLLEEFNQIFGDWSLITFDLLDPDANIEFQEQRQKYLKEIETLERKLASQLERAFVECKELNSGIQMFHIVGPLIARKTIREQVYDSVVKYADLFGQEISLVKKEFDYVNGFYEKGEYYNIPLDNGFPLYSGLLTWLQKLRARISAPYKDIELLDFELFEGEDGENILLRFNQMMNILQNFERNVLTKWATDVEIDISYGESLPLLRHDEDKIYLNFDKKLEIALKDIKNIGLLKYDIPTSISSFFEKEEIFWEARVKLERISEYFNDILSNSHSSELALIQNEFNSVAIELQPALETILWIEFDQEYIDKMFRNISSLHYRLVKTHDFIEMIILSARSWGSVPLYERIDGNPSKLLNIENKTLTVEKRAEKIDATRKLTYHLMLLNEKCLLNTVTDEELQQFENVDAKTVIQEEKSADNVIEKPKNDEELSEGPLDKSELEAIDYELKYKEAFDELPYDQRILCRSYEEYIDTIIAKEVLDAILRSILYIKFEMNNRFESNSPILTISKQFSGRKLIHVPSLSSEDPEGFESLVESLLNDIIGMAAMMPRIAFEFNEETAMHVDGPPRTYAELTRKYPEIYIRKTEILKVTKYGVDSVQANHKQYEPFSCLWLEDRENYMAEFKKYGRPLTLLEREVIGTEEFTLKTGSPTLDSYKNEIDKFIKMQDDIQKWNNYQDFFIWLRLNKRSFKRKALKFANEWATLFKQDLIDRVHISLQDMEVFMSEAKEILTKEVDKDDFEGLLKVLSVLNLIEERRLYYDNMFEPLREIVDLLNQYYFQFSEKVNDQFSDLPDIWLKVKREAAMAKHTIAPVQAYQVDLIEKQIILYQIRLDIYRDRFEKLPFFFVPFKDSYTLLDQVNEELVLLEETSEKLEKSASLFYLAGPNINKLQRCRKDVQLVKQLWDFVLIITSTIDDWKQTLWKDIDVDAMDQECKKFGKELRGLDKDIRTWDPYVYADSSLKNLMTSLRAINELQNPALRDRHWSELIQSTGVKIVMDDSTTLADLLNLNLYSFEEEVKGTVDKAVKEMAMEKILKDINNTWGLLAFEIEKHDRTGLNVIKVTEETIDSLEENQVQLQNLFASKYIAYFITEVTNWQIKLSNAEQVVSLWFEVQRKWMYLESIFIGSEDIRRQLPEDSKRFDGIDKDFKALLSTMLNDLNIVRATNKSDLIDKLERLGNQLVLCEKALNDYLETKRLAYPRFYFVSSADLLDILSNGNRPELVSKHLTKLYDSLGKLVIIGTSKNSSGMVAKELEEYVEFIRPCDCSGKVESWLNRVTESMREALRINFRRSVTAYEEKPRHQWVFDWPAQPALVATQIWWTTDTNAAFAKLEGGYENALKDYQRKQIIQLNALITLLLGDITPSERQKIMTICTIDVHCRDVVAKMILQKIEASTSFQWQSQLRHRWDFPLDTCMANICDAEFEYDYEYLGNTPRLVITPLTDRCYITLTQSLHLIMGGAPAGPAGTGKTETTKDLGKALGIMVYVFNCSEQMDYKSIGNIHKGLAQTGAWGCFDEFNRILVEVLSVVAVQVKSIQDAIKYKRDEFNFMGEIIKMRPTVGLFITMNPGYAGRTELPENLKALYRPCAMVVPDFALICEIMLVAEGFKEARLLARKFITLYTLCKELLSKQDHYDWGLRAIKSVLVVAGSLRRADLLRPEDQVLMRALRDFNIPKIVTDDVQVFMGLIGDLFPALDVPRKRSLEFEAVIRKSATDLSLQPEDGFVLKVVQLEELFAVRHSVFIIGFAGTGKSEVWKTLHRTYQNQKRKPLYNDLNPKAVTNDELFGVVNPATREWKDGLFSVIMRDQANLMGHGPKWIVLDGDIDPMWIESLNTVMDDNKVLTLASNERIALTKEMRLLFEIANLKTATPATVSRAGILYINPQDLGVGPYIASWIATRENDVEKANLTILFDKYIPPLLEVFKVRLKRIIPISDIAMVQMTTYLLDEFFKPEKIPSDVTKEWYETMFVFAIFWGFGSTLFKDQIVDWRNEFQKWWVSEFKTVKLPSSGSMFNYFVDPITLHFVPWSNLVQPFELDTDIPLQSTLVSTSETTRLQYFMDILIKNGHPVMLIGPAGSGKSVVMAEKLKSLPNNYQITNVPFNFYTNSEMLQRVLEKPLEKKTGRNFGPVGTKTMIYFVDDMNMPEVDTYGTVQPHTLIRQFMDYSHWYDRLKLTLKDIHNCQFVSCMNPTAGSFTIDPRLQRHFASFAFSAPGIESFTQILSSIVTQHLELNNFSNQVQAFSEELVRTVIALHIKMSQTFLPTASKFHYMFNLRDISNIFTGVLYGKPETSPTPSLLLRLWLHEASRVYGDKLIDNEDIKLFEKSATDIIKKNVGEFEEKIVFSHPLVYCHFAQGLAEPKYMPASSWDSLYKTLNEAQDGYNELVGALNLVLFEDAMAHICRINRILEAQRGNALLIGVGGSGKQSLTRLAAFISALDVFQVQLKKDYDIPDLKADIAALYMKAGLKTAGICFLMTDAQVPNEKFLVLVNDMLASGEIPELFGDDEIENIIGAVTNEVKSAGIPETRENCWRYFINKVRGLLKVVLCFSPVGSTLRVRVRKFPAVVNCTTIDWFHEWPTDALESVSYRFLSEMKAFPQDLREPVSSFMAYVHGTVNEISQTYLTNDKRYNYTTPKTFLELISLYGKLLRAKLFQNEDRATRLENGLLKLADCAAQVDALQETLKAQEVILKQKNEQADKLIKVVSAENEKVQAEKTTAAEEEKKVRIIEEDVGAKAKLCEEDLRKAEPALLAAQAALNTLNKNNLTELKSFGTPPDAVVNVCAAVIVLFAPKGKVPKDRSWKAAKVLMGKTDQFLNDLIYYDKEHIHPDVIKALQPYVKDPEFDPNKILSKSAAAAGLCSWVININKFNDVWLIVEPKQRALDTAQRDLKAAQDKLGFLTKRILELEQKLQSIQSELDAAIAEKQKCQDEADKTALTIDLAHRLVNGLATEKVRWRESVKSLKNQQITLPGDILLISCFISYVGCFTRVYRTELQQRKWLPRFKSSKPVIPASEGSDPFEMICDDAQIAEWNNEGLPSDRMSAENAAILTNSARFPLMIDPQLQGIKWIKQKYKSNLVVTRLTVKGYMDKIERAVSNGDILLLENIGESVDAVLDPLLGRMLIKKGTCLKMGDKEIDYNPNFRLILHTKLANPHYKPEMQAQTTLINFTVTLDGLEEQLLAATVKAERPDLEVIRVNLTQQQNNFKITLKFLEDDLLQRLSSAGENVLEDPTLVLNLETTKRTAEEIEVKAKQAKITAHEIDNARELYRPVAKRASILYFVLNELFKINPIYQFSLQAFSVVFGRAIENAVPADIVSERVSNLIDSITFATFMYTARGLFEADKLTFLFQMSLQILIKANEIEPSELDFLLRFPYTPNLQSPVSFLSSMNWGGIKSLSHLEAFIGLDKDIEGSTKRWEKYTIAECPEKEKLPGEWKAKTALQRLCILRALRPDRMTYAVQKFIEEKMGSKFVEARMVDFAKTYEETSATTITFFILSPGVDPLKDVEKQGKKLGFSFQKGNFHNVSLGQGQEVVAERAIDLASVEGQWVILQNIHLVARWLAALEKKIEITSLNPHPDYRLYLSAEPAPAPEFHILPQGILESAIKVTNEPPTGMFANLHKALDNFNQETLEMCSKEAEFKAILFSLCYFHAVVAERRKFGPQGWNRSYPFNVGDLTISVYVLFNYLEAGNQVPWEDLRYLFGEIMYGGHITDDWDRRLCRTYLEEYMQPELLDGGVNFAAGFPAPPNSDYEGFHRYIDDVLPEEGPYLYGLHPNAEIGFLTNVAERLFKVVFELQPRMGGDSGGGGASQDEIIKGLLDEIIDKTPVPFNMLEIMTRTEDRTPFIIVAFQECERMNILMNEIRRTTRELHLGLKGELTITSDMEKLMKDFFMDVVPASWVKLAYPSLMGLQSWFADLLLRLKELDDWSSDFHLPSSVWLAGFFNPQSFLTAIMQQTARKNEWPLDRMCLNVDVTKRDKSEIGSAPREGAYVNGLFMEGARWDMKKGSIADSFFKELFPAMPVIYIKAVTQDKQDVKNVYECPVYKIRMRGPTFVWTFNLKTKEKASKWTMAGVCLLLQT